MQATMDVVGQMQRQFVDYTTFLFREGILDDQFTEIQKVQNEGNPGFVVEVLSLFFEDYEKLLNNVTRILEQKRVDFNEVDAYVHRFKDSSSSIGAARLTNVCIPFLNYCEARNLEGSLRCLQQMKYE